MNNQTEKILKILLIVAIPVVFAFIIRAVFGIKAFQEYLTIMTIAFICGLPLGIGALTIYFSDDKSVEKLLYRIFMPWVPIFVIFLLTSILKIEGIICWIMVLPVF